MGLEYPGRWKGIEEIGDRDQKGQHSVYLIFSKKKRQHGKVHSRRSYTHWLSRTLPVKSPVFPFCTRSIIFAFQPLAAKHTAYKKLRVSHTGDSIHSIAFSPSWINLRNDLFSTTLTIHLPPPRPNRVPCTPQQMGCHQSEKILATIFW